MALLIFATVLGGCSRDLEKAKNAPATKELTDDAKRGFRKADAVVTKELEKGRDKIREKIK